MLSHRHTAVSSLSGDLADAQILVEQISQREELLHIYHPHDLGFQSQGLADGQFYPATIGHF